MTTRYLRQEAASVAERLRAGGVIRPRMVRRGTHEHALRFGFSDTYTVHRNIIESLHSKGIAVLHKDGSFRWGNGGQWLK